MTESTMNLVIWNYKALYSKYLEYILGKQENIRYGYRYHIHIPTYTYKYIDIFP